MDVLSAAPFDANGHSTGAVVAQVWADGTNWDPAGVGSGPYLAAFNGTDWVRVDAPPAP